MAFQRWRKGIWHDYDAQAGGIENGEGRLEKERTFGIIKLWGRVRTIPRIHTQIKNFLQELSSRCACHHLVYFDRVACFACRRPCAASAKTYRCGGAAADGRAAVQRLRLLSGERDQERPSQECTRLKPRYVLWSMRKDQSRSMIATMKSYCRARTQMRAMKRSSTPRTPVFISSMMFSCRSSATRKACFSWARVQVAPARSLPWKCETFTKGCVTLAEALRCTTKISPVVFQGEVRVLLLPCGETTSVGRALAASNVLYRKSVRASTTVIILRTLMVKLASRGARRWLKRSRRTRVSTAFSSFVLAWQ
eukprot:4841328-Pleurochrysis_carterae.AAC.2